MEEGQEPKIKANYKRAFEELARGLCESGHDPDNEDEPVRDSKLGRVRLRPMGRAIEARLRQRPDDSLADLYDPDRIARSFYKPMEAYADIWHVPVRQGNQWAESAIPHRLVLLDPREKKAGGGWKPQTSHMVNNIRTGKELKAFSETQDYRRAKFFEVTGDWVNKVAPDDWKRYVETAVEPQKAPTLRRKLRESDTSFDDDDSSGAGSTSVTRDIDQEFIPLIGGPYYRNLTLYAHWEQTAKAFYESNHSELARSCINTTSDFTLGRGLSWKIKNRRVAEIWQEFWDRNNMGTRMRVLSNDLCWQGELLIRKYEPLKGFLAIRSIDPSTVLEIVTLPEDIESVLFYHQSFPTQFQQPFQDLRGQKVDVATMKYVITQFPANEIFHLKNNVSSSEKWGRSDFYCSFGTLKRHRDWTNAATLKDLLQCNLVWKIKITGDDSDVQAFMNDSTNSQLPAMGGTWIENDALTLEAIHEDVAGSQRMGPGSTGQFLMALFATGVNTPVTFFNGSAPGVARSTALTQSEPFAKRISTRQQMTRALLDHLYESVMRSAVNAGRIDARLLAGEDADPEWLFPSTYEEDRGAKFKDLDSAYATKSISHRTVSVQKAQELNLPEYDYDREMQTVGAEAGNQVLNPPAPAPYGGGMDMGGGEQPVANEHERLAGAEERARFKAQQQEHPVTREGFSAVDQKFIEAARKVGVIGGIRLPSGRRFMLREAA